MSLSPLGGVAFHGNRVFVPFKHDGDKSRLAQFIREKYKDQIADLKVVGDVGVDIKFSTYSKAKSELDVFDLDLSKIFFSKLHTRYYFAGSFILPQMLPTEMKRYCQNHRICMKIVKDADIYKVSDGLYCGKFGTIMVKRNELVILAAWKSFVLTFFTAKSSVHHEFERSSTGIRIQVLEEYVDMQISMHRCYHGATFHKTKILDMITHKWNGPYQVVVSKPYVSTESMYNVAVVNNGKWICAVCEKKFDEPVKWAQHFHHPVILNYSDTTWKEARVTHGKFVEGNVYKYQISCPCSTHTQNSLMVKKIMDPKHGWFQKILKKAITKATSTAEVMVLKSDILLMNTDPAYSSWEDIGLSIRFLVELERRKWDKQQQWGLQFKRDHLNSRNVALSYEESQEKRKQVEIVKQISKDITKRHAERIDELKKAIEKEECGHSVAKKRRVSEEEAAEASRS